MLHKYCITKVNTRTYSIMYLCIQHYQFIIVIIIFIVIIIIWKLSTKSNTISPTLFVHCYTPIAGRLLIWLSLEEMSFMIFLSM